MGYKITIDGPAGTGKGTLARELATAFNIINVDSGSLYRTFGLYAIRNNIDITNCEEIKKALKNVDIELKKDNSKNVLVPYLNGKDVSGYIRTEEVARVTSRLAVNEDIREFMKEKQHKVAKDRDIVMEGRDIGSEVFPDAELKIFLNADESERANRRYKELKAKGEDVTYEHVLEIIRARDIADSTRKISPLIKTEDMIEIDTTNLTVQEVVDKVKLLMKEKGLV